MPVFHTKTIEAILEPVAQQVSQLVILHEEAEDGSAMPDLSVPIQAVGVAVTNLVKVGKETAASSKDKILKEDMPHAFTRVEESSLLLMEASKLLKSDPHSPVARRKLIDGARGILSGTSALLLTFDEAEVRKILALCKGVLDYLAIVEVVESMEDLVEFVKNLTPGMREMAKNVEAREKELTHQVHRDMLKNSINSVKELTPLLISSVKAYVSAKATDQGVAESQENRNYVVGRMSAEISEIMRVLQLTTYEEDGSDDPLNEMKKAASVFNSKIGKAKDWLGTPAESAGGLGERAVRDCIREGRKVADASQDPDKTRIREVCNDLDKLMDDLAELRRLGKGTTPEAQKLTREVASKLGGLKNDIDQAIQRQTASGVKKPFDTFVGKMEQAQQWLNNPAGDHSGLGERAIRECAQEGRRAAEQCSGKDRLDILQLCDDLDRLCDELADLKRRGMGNSPQARAVASNIERTLDDLNNKLQKVAVERVVDDFMDTTTPLKQLEKAARAPVGTPNRKEDFEDKAATFEHAANQTSDTAVMLANTGGNTNKRLLDDIKNTATEVKELTPQVSHAAKILLLNPDNEAASSHFDAMKKEWQGKVEKMTDLVDSATDTPAFLEASEEAIKRDSEALDAGMAQQNAPIVAAKSSNIARRAKRVASVVQAEADNSEDPEYVHNLNKAKQDLEQTISPLIIDAKSVATNLKDKDAQKKLKNSTRKVRDAVHEVRKVVITSLPPAEEEFPPPPPDIDAMYISEQEQAPPRPPPPSESAPPPRPPPPVEEETVDERAQLLLEQPPEDNPMALAAHQLHKEALKWEEQGNDIIQAAKKMAMLFAQMSKFMSEEEEGTPHSKKELIALAKQIANESKEVVKHASKVAKQCSDKRLRQVMEQTVERIPTISTQLKIVATVKATMIGANDPTADMEATETLVGCAENLMSAVRQTVRETEAASVKMRHDAGTLLRWRKK